MPKHIFIVDDDQAILEVITIVLEDAGYKVSAITGYDVLFSMLRTTKPALILLDISMPGESGQQITKKLKENNKTRHIPVIIVSAKTDIAEIAKDAGANGYLEKPFELEQLLNTVEKYTTSKLT